ncbi:MAG: hypothetical protein R6V62_08775 [Candidatus Fermentibacteraceae bacterium]
MAPLLQFHHPAKAHLMLAGNGSWTITGFSAMFILFGGFAATAGSPASLPALPLFILFERMFMAALGGTAAWALARALGEKFSILPCIQSTFMSMTVWVLGFAALVWISRVAGIPPGFSWSLAELAWRLPVNPAEAFFFIVLLNLDIPSVVTVFIWGRGLSAVWGTDPSLGMRLVWAVYLFAVLLQAVPVLLNQGGSEVLGL